MHDGMPYGRNQGQGQGHSREVDRQSPTGLIFCFSVWELWMNFNAVLEGYVVPADEILMMTVQIQTLF